MPSIVPSYVYSIFAALIVGTIIVYSVSVATADIRSDANSQQLSNIEQYVAAQGLTLLSQTTQDNMNTTQYLDIPPHIGNQRFTIRIANDSHSAWVESGFGVNITSSDMHVGLPAKVTASGSFVSGSGRPLLQCHYENQIATIILTKE